MKELDAVLKLGGYAAPVKTAPIHPFLVVEGNRFCGTCGGGILHPIHQTPPQPQESAPGPKV